MAATRRKPAGAGPHRIALESLIGFMLRRAHFAAENHYLRLAGDDPLTPRQFGVLLQLEAAGPLTIAELGKRMYVDRNTLAEMIHRMARRGLLRKRTPPDNRRSVEVSVAPAGRAALARALPVATRSQQEVLDRIPARQRAAFIRCLAAIAALDDEPPSSGR